MTKGHARRIGTALCGTGMLAIAMGAGAYFAHAAYATPAVDGSHQVWVCKYVGQPGDFETLKAGKNPIIVDVAAADAYVGADFADGQTHSKVIDLATDENTGQGETYTGEATCPVSEATTTTTVPATTTTTVPATTTTAPATTTTVPATTTTAPEGTTTAPVLPKRPTAVLVPATTPPAAPTAPVLPFTGSTTLPLLGVGLAMIGAGAGIVRKMR